MLEVSREIIALRRQHRAIGDHVLPSLHKVIGVLFNDREKGPVFRDFRRLGG